MDNENIENTNDGLQQPQRNEDVVEHASETSDLFDGRTTVLTNENNRDDIPFYFKETYMTPISVPAHLREPDESDDCDVSHFAFEAHPMFQRSPHNGGLSCESMAALQQFSFVTSENNNEGYCITCEEDY